MPLRAGTREVVAAVFQLADAAPFTLTIPVTVTWPPLAKLEVVPEPGRLYTGVTLGHQVKAFHADGSERTEVQVSWTGSNPRVATVDRYGNVTAVRPGNLTVTAVAEGVKGERLHTVVANPVQGLSIDISQASQQRAVVRQAGAQGPGAVKARAWANRSTRRVPCCGTT
ncbi:MAG: Ig-like domain-containing protein [Gemmatimonadetes bacterium]|nr:Ig-like domain-containing protein [Gemmatimonadota bacterium]